MPEYIVDCEELPYGEGRTLVLPVSINGHVHERLTRCGDCALCSESLPHYCRAWHNWIWDEGGFCFRAKPRTDDD